jgi:hypothetical protein
MSENGVKFIKSRRSDKMSYIGVLDLRAVFRSRSGQRPFLVITWMPFVPL